MQIDMLGPLDVRTDSGIAIEVPGARLRGLLTALAQQPGRVVSRTMLIDWIWGAFPPADAANALQRLVSRLRKTLGATPIEGQPDGYRLMIDPDAVDVVRFEHLVGQARHQEAPRRARLLLQALELWRGQALQDVGLQDSDAVDAAVRRLTGLRQSAREDLYVTEVSLGRGVDLIDNLTELVAADPLRERLVGALMRALAADGRDAEALLVYQRTREALADALGTDPSAELSQLHTALLRGEVERRQQRRATNLRAELTSFVGKDADVAAVRGLIADHRLTTLIGPGGSGKTRLATETGRRMLAELPDGVWLVELAPIAPDGEVGQPALTTLGLRDALLDQTPNPDPTDRLIAAIGEREMLLILDNCEHLIESAAAFVYRALGECRQLRILATSREPLGITGEQLWPVEPLAVPDPDARPEEIESSPAVQLLRDRAQAVRKDLAGDSRALSVMLRVCQALDGMPLAIELAAARLRTMSLDQLANRLDDRFRLLTGGSRTVLPRHRTLRAVIDWSWELLSDAERAVLRRLAAFSGGADLEAAEQVCAGDGVEPDDVLELLGSLTEKSLLVTAGDTSLRFRMLGTIKEYAADRLAEAGESDRVRRAHLDYFTELTETADPHLRRAGQLEWLARLAADDGNISAAMRGAIAAGEAQAAMRLAAAGSWYWWLSGHKAEGMELITAATELPGEVTDEVRALVYTFVIQFLSSGPADEHRSEDWIHRAYELSERIEPSRWHSPVLKLIAPLERMLQAPNESAQAFEPLLADDDPWVRAMARLQVGKMRIIAGHGGRDADAILEQALAEFRTLGERFGIWFALTELADRVAVRGEFAEACELYDQGVVVITELGSVEDIIRMRARQAQLYWLLGDEESSTAAMAQAEQCAERVNWPSALADLALLKAELARWRGDRQDAHQQLRAATTLLGEGTEQAGFRATTHDLLGYLTEDLEETRVQRAAACAAAAEAGHATVIARVLVGVADLALRENQYEQVARLLAASAAVRGLPDRSLPDVARIEREARRALGGAGYADAIRDGDQANWTDLVAVTLTD